MKPESEVDASLVAKVSAALKDEFGHLHPKRAALGAIASLLPVHLANRMRAALLREMGFQVGEGTLVYGAPKIAGGGDDFAQKLRIGRDCVIELGCHFDLGEKITLGDGVFLGKEVLILTTSHELGPKEHRAGLRTFSPVTIGSGAWIGTRAMILPGVTVGEGAIVDAGALVSKDVEANTRVAGSPAKRTESLAT